MKIELDLSDEMVKKIEELTGTTIVEVLESEINLDGDNFIKMMGYDRVS